MESEPTIEDVCGLVAVQLGRSEVAARDRLVEDLGAESVDVVNIIAGAEDRFGITIDEAELPDVVTVADLYERVRERVG